MSAPAPESTASGTDGADERTATERDDPLTEVPSGWRIRLRAVWRLFVVTWAFLPLGLSWWRDRRRFLLFGGSREVSGEQRRARAEVLLDTFLELGPTFIKLGQLLSTRPDVLPREYIEVLAQLQDQVPPADFERIEPILASEVGPVDEVFEDFDREAISGASLGQVYTATLDGERVAVKVLRPGIRRRVEADLRVLSVVIPLIVRVSPEGQAFTLENLAEEFAATIRREMDYGREAATLREVAGNFADDPKVRMPGVYGEYSTDRVIVMEYVEGTKITDIEALDAMGVDRDELVVRLEEAYVQMIVEDGVFHADPHPGNLAVQDDGTLVFYDFGMNGRLGPGTRDLLFEFYVALAEEDIDRVIDVFIALDSLDPRADREVMRKVFSVAIDNFRGRDIEQYRIEEIVAEFQGTMREFPMRLPRNMALVVRVTSVLEGVCRTLDPEFDFITVIREYVRERSTDEETIDRVREEIRSRVVDLEGSLRRLPPKVDQTLTRAQRENLQVSMAVADDGRLVRRLARRVALGALTGAAVVGTATLYALGEPTGAAVAGGVAVASGLATRRTFRTRRASRDVRATAGVAERSLEQRREERAEHARE
jgi:predicted unusual protein kinase regulating ubiquinone biosynthesis (AarF/ABC1/UbiB family)